MKYWKAMGQFLGAQLLEVFEVLVYRIKSTSDCSEEVGAMTRSTSNTTEQLQRGGEGRRVVTGRVSCFVALCLCHTLCLGLVEEEQYGGAVQSIVWSGRDAQPCGALSQITSASFC